MTYFTATSSSFSFSSSIPNPLPEPALDNGSAARAATEMDAKTEKDLLKLMQQPMAQPK